MAIQNRRGVYSDFDPTKLLPGEYAVVQNGDPDGAGGYALYLCYKSGVVKRLVSADDLNDAIAAFDLSWTNIEDKPEAFPTTWANITDKPSIRSGTGTGSVAEGGPTTEASGDYAHAEGVGTKATAPRSHAEGATTQATGWQAHAEGSDTIASARNAHSEGSGTRASGQDSHSEGRNTVAAGNMSHAEGIMSVANNRSQHVFGECNVEDPSTGGSGSRGTYVEIVGNGTSTQRSNARTLDWNGNEILSGNLTVSGGTVTVGNVLLTAAELQSLIDGNYSFTDPNNDGNIVIST